MSKGAACFWAVDFISQLGKQLPSVMVINGSVMRRDLNLCGGSAQMREISNEAHLWVFSQPNLSFVHCWRMSLGKGVFLHMHVAVHAHMYTVLLCLSCVLRSFLCFFRESALLGWLTNPKLPQDGLREGARGSEASSSVGWELTSGHIF